MSAKQKQRAAGLLPVPPPGYSAPQGGVFTIEKEFHFSASHHLTDYVGKCNNHHGHNYVVKLELSSATLSGPGFVREFGDLDEFKRWIDDNLDHEDLNEVLPGEYGRNPTTEKLAQYLFLVASIMFPELDAVHISETPKTWVTFRPNPVMVCNALPADFNVSEFREKLGQFSRSRRAA